MDYPDEDTIRILITTDNHVGYNENDPVTGDDSWKTFHEILMMASNNNVDMILQSGDLFHVNKPSKKSLYQVMKSLRLSCMGNKPCELELLSDPSRVFEHTDFTNVNYEDPNFNISIPMFAISGNHDDATGDTLLCPLDILHASGLVNHYGKVMQTDKIQLTPLLFQKGKTKLALYGLASVRDERLFRTFKEGNVSFEVPAMTENGWFNLLCLHQNHTGHTNTAFLPEQFLPEFLDLVIWGHEHECIPHLVHNPIKNFDVLQPGSSVATSLCDAEEKQKFVFILEVKYGQPPKLIPLPLNTVRTFLMKTISLSDVSYLRPHDKEAINKYLSLQIEELISEANELTKKKMNIISEGDGMADITDDEILNEIPLPLIRLRVDYSNLSDNNSNIDYHVENPRRFSNRFVGRVANSNNIIQFFKKKKKLPKNHKNISASRRQELSQLDLNEDEIERIVHESEIEGELKIQTLIDDFLNKMQLSLLPEVGMNEAVKKFVDKDEKLALKEFIDEEIKNEVKILSKNKDFNYTEDVNELKDLLKQVKKINASRSNSTNTNQSESRDEDIVPEKSFNPFDDEFDMDVNMEGSRTEKCQDDIQPPKKTVRRTTSSKVKNPRARKSSSTARLKPISDSIVISDSDEEMNDQESNLDFSTSEFDDDPIELDEEIPSSRKQTSKRQAKRPSKSTAQKARSSKTPKTDILQSLLAKKSR